MQSLMEQQAESVQRTIACFEDIFVEALEENNFEAASRVKDILKLFEDHADAIKKCLLNLTKESVGECLEVSKRLRERLQSLREIQSLKGQNT